MLTVIASDTQAVQWQGKLEGDLPDWFEKALNHTCSPFDSGSIGFAGYILYIGTDNGLIKVLPGNWVLYNNSGEISYCSNETITNVLRDIVSR